MTRQQTDSAGPGGFHGAFRQSMSWLHTWLGLLAGLILYFMFVTGTTGYAHHEITRWMTPELAAAPPGERRSPAEQAEAALALALQRNPGARLVYLTLPVPGREDTGYVNIYSEPPAAAEGKEPREGFEGKLDPVTLKELTAGDVRETGGGETLYAMHYNLHYIPFTNISLFGVDLPAWPTLIVGAATMFMLIAIVTGIVVHKKIFADFFTFRLGKGQRSWLDAHNLSSVMALPFMLMITYSGLIMYPFDYMPAPKAVAYGRGEAVDTAVFDCEAYNYWCDRREAAGAPAAVAHLGPMIARAQSEYPDDAIKWIDFHNPGDRNGTITIWPSAAQRFGEYPYITFDAATGEVLRIRGGREGDPVGRTGEVLLALHEGHFAGPLLRWLYLGTGAMGAAMVATGLVLWTVKRRQKLKGNTPADFGLAFVERTNVAVVAGLLIAVAACFWANRLLPVGMDGRAEWEVHAMFIAWGLTFLHAALRPARRAWIEQIAVLAVVLAGLPVLNALTTEIHLGRTLFGIGGNTDWVLASFDLTMLGLALLFGGAVVRVQRRQIEARNYRQETEALASDGMT